MFFERLFSPIQENSVTCLIYSFNNPMLCDIAPDSDTVANCYTLCWKYVPVRADDHFTPTVTQLL